MTDGDALHAAILAAPDDDTLRLVYADWLDENHQPARAAFIRVQIQAAQAEPFSPDARRLAAAADRILEQNRSAWTRIVRQRTADYAFARGFVECAVVNLASFPQDAAALFAAEPVRTLKVLRFDTSAGPAPAAPLFMVPELTRITKLDLSGLKLPADYFEPLSNCPYLTNLTDLGLQNTPVPPQWLTTLLTGPALPQLVGLDVSDAAHLGQCLAGVLPQLDRQFLRLNMSCIPFTSRQMQQVLGSRSLRQVEELRLGWLPSRTLEGVLTHLNLGWVLPWERLRLLDLSGHGLGQSGVDEIVREIERRRKPSPLRWLGLAYNRLGPDAVRALCDSDPAKLQLYYLDVRGNDLPLSAIATLQNRFPEAIIPSR